MYRTEIEHDRDIVVLIIRDILKDRNFQIIENLIDCEPVQEMCFHWECSTLMKTNVGKMRRIIKANVLKKLIMITENTLNTTN